MITNEGWSGWRSIVSPVLLDALTTEPASDSSAGFRDMAGQLVVAMGLFLLVVYVVYLLYKYLLSGRGGNTCVFGKSRHMKVLEITSVGPGSTIQLVKVSEEYFLIGVTKGSITFLTKTHAPPDEFSESPQQLQRSVPFEKYLSRFIKPREHMSSDQEKEE